MTARSKGKIQEIVYWYNLTPMKGLDNSTSPSSQLFNNKSCVNENLSIYHNEYLGEEFSIGEDILYVKPVTGNPRCTLRWRERE